MQTVAVRGRFAVKTILRNGPTAIHYADNAHSVLSLCGRVLSSCHPSESDQPATCRACQYHDSLRVCGEATTVEDASPIPRISPA
jgi:hypothetical protein